MIADALYVRRTRGSPDRMTVPVRAPGHSAAEREARALRRRFMAPLTILLGLVTIIPAVYGLYLSFTAGSGAGRFVGLSNYASLLKSSSFHQSVVTTAILTVLSVAITMLLGTWLAFAILRINHGRHVIRALLLLPLATAPIAAMYSWKEMLNSSYGVVNYLLRLVDVEPVAWFGASTPALTSILVIDVWQWTCFVMVIVFGGLVSVSDEILEAAEVDGAGPLARLRYIILPAIAPYLLMALFFRAVDALKIFDSIAVLTGGGPGSATTTMNWFSYRQMIQYLDFGSGTAAAFLLLILGLIFTSALVFYLRRAAESGETR